MHGTSKVVPIDQGQIFIACYAYPLVDDCIFPLCEVAVVFKHLSTVC